MQCGIKEQIRAALTTVHQYITQMYMSHVLKA